ncbi:hypothetical protein DFH06DRAFT_1150625 [Mycena polygramma]|nr:hypothetical protein DFH06DRAFT_1150625 [Mycena polygramma]
MAVLDPESGATANTAPPPGSSSELSPGSAASPRPALISHIHTSGPWTAGRLFSVVPPCPLVSAGETDEMWYAITKGRFIGVTNIHALEQAAIIRVSGAAHKGYPTQAAALRAFNAALYYNACEVVPV